MKSFLPQATGTQECQKGRVCSVWPHGAEAEPVSFRVLGQHVAHAHSKTLISIPATGWTQQG